MIFIVEKSEKKVAIVSGASGGLGSKIVESLRREDYIVAGCSAQKREDAGDADHWRHFDLTNEILTRRFVAQVLEKFKRIDLLINCVGYITAAAPFEKTSVADMKRIFDVNVCGPAYLMQEVLPIFKAQNSGVIINVSSKSGVYNTPNLAAYSGSKSAIIAITQSVAKELIGAGSDVKCFTASPAGIKTKMRAKSLGEGAMANQQNPGIVAEIIVEMAVKGTVAESGRLIKLPNGANVIIKNHNANVREMLDDKVPQRVAD